MHRLLVYSSLLTEDLLLNFGFSFSCSGEPQSALKEANRIVLIVSKCWAVIGRREEVQWRGVRVPQGSGNSLQKHVFFFFCCTSRAVLFSTSLPSFPVLCSQPVCEGTSRKGHFLWPGEHRLSWRVGWVSRAPATVWLPRTRRGSGFLCARRVKSVVG